MNPSKVCNLLDLHAFMFIIASREIFLTPLSIVYFHQRNSRMTNEMRFFKLCIISESSYLIIVHFDSICTFIKTL